MAQGYVPQGVLLVGSVPFSSAEEVFTRSCTSLPHRLLYLADGETGERDNFIGWQLSRFPQDTIQFFLGGSDGPPAGQRKFDIDSVKPTGYDDAAISSYAKFKDLQKEGVIPLGTRFKVCLPSPFNCLQGHIREEFRSSLEPFYEQRMEDSLRRIVSTIPASDLAIQWDMALEVGSLEFERGETSDAMFRPYYEPVMKGTLDRISRFCDLIPSTVKLGFHLCYGDFNHQHFLQPESLAIVVDLANGIANRVAAQGGRQIDWLHLPVPRDREDSAYFEPLKTLDSRFVLLYLGLVHPHDEEGTRKRIETAHKIYDRPFGVATECGLGRTPKAVIESIFQISRDVTTTVPGLAA